MKTTHNSSRTIRQCRARIAARNSAALAEFHRDAIGMHQELDLNKTEEELMKELKVLTTRIDFPSLAARTRTMFARSSFTMGGRIQSTPRRRPA